MDIVGQIENYYSNIMDKSKERSIITMKGTEEIKSLGTVNLEGISMEEGRLEIHVPIDEVAKPLSRVFDRCTKDYIKKYGNVKSCKELNYDVRVILSCGSFQPDSEREAEFNLFIIVWQSSDDETGEDTAEFYEDIPVFFEIEDTEKLKKIVWYELGKVFFYNS